MGAYVYIRKHTHASTGPYPEGPQTRAGGRRSTRRSRTRPHRRHRCSLHCPGEPCTCLSPYRTAGTWCGTRGSMPSLRMRAKIFKTFEMVLIFLRYRTRGASIFFYSLFIFLFILLITLLSYFSANPIFFVCCFFFFICGGRGNIGNGGIK